VVLFLEGDPAIEVRLWAEADQLRVDVVSDDGGSRQ